MYATFLCPNCFLIMTSQLRLLYSPFNHSHHPCDILWSNYFQAMSSKLTLSQHNAITLNYSCLSMQHFVSQLFSSNVIATDIIAAYPSIILTEHHSALAPDLPIIFNWWKGTLKRYTIIFKSTLKVFWPFLIFVIFCTPTHLQIVRQKRV